MTAEESASIEPALVAARQMRPYYARALSALTPVAADGFGTVGVDRSWRLYVDLEWFGSLPLDQQAAVLSQHEIEHLLRDHGARARAIHADPDLWQIAADVEINDDADPGVLPPMGIYPKDIAQPEGLRSEDYYSALESAVGHHCGGGSGAGVPLEGELESGESPGLSAAESEVLRDHVASDVRAHMAARGRGDVPRGVQVWAEARERRVVIPWLRELRLKISSQVRETVRGRQDWSWSRPSRRTAMVIRPGMISFRPRMGIVIDTSGSMSDRGADVLGIVRSAAISAGTARVWQVDAAIQRRGKRHRSGATYHGGGGTDLRPALKDAARVSDVIVAITDCETRWPEELDCAMTVDTWRGGASSPLWAHRIELTP